MLITNSTASVPSFDECCRRQGWRRTAQRRAVYDCLLDNRSHPSVEAVWASVKAALPDVSLDSIYRILDAFADAGYIRRLDGDRVIRYDADTGRHGHFICSRCSRMLDFPIPDPEFLAGAGRRLGLVESVELCVHGVCADCLGQKGIFHNGEFTP